MGYILAFLVLALSCLPCADSVASTKPEKAKVEIIQATDQSEDDHGDACSPFCQCACCASFSINHSIATIFCDINYPLSSYCSFLPPDTIEISLPIWQPPRVA